MLGPEDASTARLVARAQCGDDASFERLCARYRARVHAFLAARLDDPHEAEDVTQEVFERARRALPRYRPQAGVPWRAWLFTIARNRALSQLSRRPDVELVEPSELELRLERLSAPIAARTNLGWIDDDALVELFGQLPQAQQDVLTLRYQLDLSVADTARILGRSENSVAVLHHRAKNRLRTAFAL